MPTATLSTGTLISDFLNIQFDLHRNVSKITHDEMLNLFMNNEKYSSEARLIVGELVNKAYSGYGFDKYVFSYNVAWQIDILILRAQRGEYR